MFLALSFSLQRERERVHSLFKDEAIYSIEHLLDPRSMLEYVFAGLQRNVSLLQGGCGCI